MFVRLVGSLLLACTPTPDGDSGVTAEEVDGLTFPVDAPGPFGVGYRTWDVTYTPGPEIPPRTIVVSLWYPADDTSGAQTTDTMGFVLADTRRDAPLAGSAYGGTYPVVVHSHGYQGWSGNSAFLWHHLATHGWLVVVPDHTDNTLFGAVEPLPTAHYFERPLDVRAALDSVRGEVGDAADVDRVLLTGHSFGVYTTWGAGGATYDQAAIAARCDAGEIGDGTCTEAERAMFASDLSDDRVIATLPMAGSYDPDWFGETGYRTIQGPVFAMSGSEDDVGADDQWARMTDLPLTWIDVEGGCHQTFGIGGCADLDDATGWSIVETYALAYARAQVLGDVDPTVTGILDGSVEVSDRVTFQRR